MNPESMAFYFPSPLPAGSISWWQSLNSSEDTEGESQRRGSSSAVLVPPTWWSPSPPSRQDRLMELWMLPGNYTQGTPQDWAPALPSAPQTAQHLALPLRGCSRFCFPKCMHQAWRQTHLDLLFQFTSHYGKITALYLRSMQPSQTKKPAFLRNN